MHSNQSLKNLFFSLKATSASLADELSALSLDPAAWDVRTEDYAIRLKRRYLFASEEAASDFESRVRRHLEQEAGIFVIAQKMVGSAKVCLILRFQPERSEVKRAGQLVAHCERVYRERFVRQAQDAA